jgi:hypothetical protein
MSYLLIAAAALGLGSGIVLWGMRRRRPPVSVASTRVDAGIPSSPRRHERDYRAVGIAWDSSKCPCRMAEELADQRFLLSDAPPLPLPGCEVQVCHCHYQRFQDRRDDDMRRAGHQLHEGVCSQTGVSNRRSRFDRRAIGMD